MGCPVAKCWLFHDDRSVCVGAKPDPWNEWLNTYAYIADDYPYMQWSVTTRSVNDHLTYWRLLVPADVPKEYRAMALLLT